MKKIMTICFLAFAAAGLQAQTTSFDALFQKYAGKEGITTVEVTQKLFTLCASALGESDDDIKELVSGLKGIKIITYENSEDHADGKAMYKEFEAALPSGFDELMTVNSDGEKVRFLGRVVNGTMVDELILLVDDEDEFVMIDIIGLLDFEKIGKLSDMNIDIDGMDELKKIDGDK